MDLIETPGVVERATGASLPDLAYQAILQDILDRQLAPGDRLNIDRLAQRLGMSSIPVREALNRLAAQRLAIQETNRGFSVAPLLSTQEYRQLFETRYVLETTALRQVQPTPADLERLQEIVDRSALTGHGPEYRGFGDFNRADRAFHHILVGMAGNPFLTKAWDDLHVHLHISRLYAGKGVIGFDYLLAEHAAIVAALRQGDLEAFYQAADQHLVRAVERLQGVV
jgi:DNA-binding GntR family transcriptional regulator